MQTLTEREPVREQIDCIHVHVEHKGCMSNFCQNQC